jgi:hypothetical protein
MCSHIGCSKRKSKRRVKKEGAPNLREKAVRETHIII